MPTSAAVTYILSMLQYSPEAEHGKHTLLAAEPEQKTPEDKASTLACKNWQPGSSASVLCN